jgi:anti-sigma factor ChrR (cupin superfamily)
MHPDVECLDRYENGELTADEQISVANHLLWCQTCRDLTRDQRMLAHLLEKLRADPGD